MNVISTRIRTPHASRYLQQLCKHFAHKVAVAYDRETGRAALPPGPCLMLADGEALTFHCLPREPRAVPVLQGILVNHLVKFAWREELEIAWTEGAPDDVAALLADPGFLPPKPDRA